MSKKLSPEALIEKLGEAEEIVSIGGAYRHYKGSMYLVTELGIDEATETVSVIYQDLHNEQLTFIRPLTSWIEKVEVDGHTRSRFMQV